MGPERWAHGFLLSLTEFGGLTWTSFYAYLDPTGARVIKPKKLVHQNDFRVLAP